MNPSLPARVRPLLSAARHTRLYATAAKPKTSQSQVHPGAASTKPSSTPGARTPASPAPPSPATPEKKPAAKSTKTRGRKKKSDTDTDTPTEPTSTASSSSSSSDAASAPEPAATTPSPIREPTPAERAAVVFGAALSGPSRRRSIDPAAQATLVAGVLYREDMEEYAAASTEATRRLAASSSAEDAPSRKEARNSSGHRHSARSSKGRQFGRREAQKEKVDVHAAGSMDDDGGGSESNWAAPVEPQKIAKDLWDEELYKNVPVGIREFMKVEKKLKERHEREGTTG
ncbi:unnamed protein product [Parascedosporium putredinis]|uniref:Uncharacterized protein n=1 Tax=Parascedosporium putredinis TaxID=1442378 RepID=A0A9P1H007_9PEZI|nr:unnamed protein product [Parascedosporium putredinis]CAI7992223.1 unnamed protein product [Parascedosporium putredinis]